MFYRAAMRQGGRKQWNDSRGGRYLGGKISISKSFIVVCCLCFIVSQGYTSIVSPLLFNHCDRTVKLTKISETQNLDPKLCQFINMVHGTYGTWFG